MSQESRARMFRRVACVVALGATVAGTSGCWIEARAAYPVGVYADYPPDAYIATTPPVYYEGHASYWYGGRWYYRDGGRWGHYEGEPRVLYERRREAPPARRVYERSWGQGRSEGHSGEHHEGRSGGHR
jgi:hypothetical protein